MKLSLLVTLMALAASCGKIQNLGGSGALGTVRSLQVTTIPSSDAVVFDRICQALTRKGQKLESSLPNSISFAVADSDCNKNAVSDETQAVRIEKSSSGEFLFRRQDSNSLFYMLRIDQAGDWKIVDIDLSKLSSWEDKREYVTCPEDKEKKTPKEFGVTFCKTIWDEDSKKTVIVRMHAGCNA